MTPEVNGVPITEEAIARELPHHSGEAEPRESALRALAVRELLLQEARRVGVEAGDEDERIEELIAREVGVPQATEAECANWFRNNRARFRAPDMVEASHILFEMRPEEAPAIRQRAEDVLREVLAHPDRFKALAHRHSRCPSGAHGGNLGQLTRGETAPEFEAAIFALAEGRIRDSLLATRFGLHIIRVDRRMMGARLPFEAVKDRIAAFLNERVRRRAEQQYLKILVGQANIRGIGLEGAPTPLVQ